MANTQVFTLGVTTTESLGSALEVLRRRVDGIRLGRLIGEVIRLGLELDKVRLVERSLALEQTEQHEAQILRLGREIDQVERLRQGYLSLMRVRMPSLWLGIFTSHAISATTSEAKAEKEDSADEARKPRSTQDKLQRAGAVAAGLVVGGRALYEVDQSMGPNARRRVHRAVRKTWKAGAGDARDKVVDALLSDGTGEEKAQQVGAAGGSLGGSLLGAIVATRFKNRQIKRYLPKLGATLGEAFGKEGGGRLFNWFSYEDEAKPGASASQTSQPTSEQQTLTETQQEQVPPTAAALAAEPAASGMLASFADSLPSVGTGTGTLLKASRGVMKRIPGAALVSTGLQLAETFNSDASPGQKLESYGTAVGGLGGGLAGAAAGAAIGSVVPVVGTAIGALVGGVLGSMGGEGLGGLLGKALGSAKDDTSVGKATDTSRAPELATAPPALSPSVAASPPPAPINQQFTFTANMPVTFTNSLSDPSVLQQLEAIARRQLEDLMRQARSVQLADTPHIAL